MNRGGVRGVRGRGGFVAQRGARALFRGLFTASVCPVIFACAPLVGFVSFS
jgi:hypothetical protein